MPATAPSFAPNIQGSTGMIPYGGNNFFNYGANPSANPFAGGLGSSNISASDPTNFLGAYTGTFGKGFGTAYSNLLSTGGYNPAVFNALVNQLQPQISSDIATLGASAGAAGTRFSSGYELGLGDYLSQVNANEMGMAANLYQQSVQNQMGLLESSMPYNYQNAHAPGFWQSFGEGLLNTAGSTIVGGLTGGIGSLLGGLFKGGGGFQGGVTDPGGSFGSGVAPTGISGIPGTVPGQNAPSFDMSTLSNLLAAPSTSGQQTYSDILGAGFAGATGANILGTAYGSPAQ